MLIREDNINRTRSSRLILSVAILIFYIYIYVYIRIPGQFIKRRKWWFGPPHQGRFDIFNDDGIECSRLDPTYQRHITFACTGCYQLHPHHRLGIITPDFSPSTNLPTPKGWIAWLAKEDFTHITFAQGYYTIKFKGTGRTQVVCSKTNSIPVNQPRCTL